MQLIASDPMAVFESNGKVYFCTIGKQDAVDCYFCFDGTHISVIDLQVFNMERYGKHFDKIIKLYQEWDCWAYGKDGSVFVCSYRKVPFDSKVYQFDKNGVLSSQYDEMGKIDSIYDIQVEGTSIWCVYPTSHTIKRFSLVNGREEITISEGNPGLDRGSIFCFPESISIQENIMYVSDMGNKRICAVDLDTYVTSTYREFVQPVFGYFRASDAECALLNSGLYIL